MESEISMIDFTSYISGDSNSKLNVSKDLVKSMRAHGFVFLRNFGIKREEISEIFGLAEEFFQSPIELKQSVKKSHKTFCGYDKIESEKGSLNRDADYKESFMVNQTGTPWPHQNILFKEKMLSFHKKCFDFCMDIFTSILLGLGVDSKSFSDQFSKGECAMLRLLHYPPMPELKLKNQLWCGEVLIETFTFNLSLKTIRFKFSIQKHTDYGAITILFQNSVGGLEIQNQNKSWIPAPIIEDTVLVNIGDCMEMWTSGYLKATPHRVVSSNEEDKKSLARYSIVFFFQPDLSCKLTPFQKFQDLIYEKKHLSKTYGEHANNKYNYSYSGFNEQV